MLHLKKSTWGIFYSAGSGSAVHVFKWGLDMNGTTVPPLGQELEVTNESIEIQLGARL